LKKILIPLLVIILLLTAVAPALAGSGPQPARGKGRKPFALVGTITAINGSTVTVHVIAGNRLVKPSIGTDLALATNDLTRFRMRTEDGDTQIITLADLAVGQNVSVNGVIKADVWLASRVTVGPELTHLP